MEWAVLVQIRNGQLVFLKQLHSTREYVAVPKGFNTSLLRMGEDYLIEHTGETLRALVTGRGGRRLWPH